MIGASAENWRTCTDSPTPSGSLVQLGDIEVYAEVHGEGSPLVCLPGAANVLEWYRPMFTALSQQYQVISLDWPGCGRSPACENISTNMLAETVIQLAEHFGHQKFTVIGQSMGALITQMLLVQHPSKIDLAIMLNAAVMNADKDAVEALDAGRLEHPVAEVAHMESDKRIAAVGPVHFSASGQDLPAYQHWLTWQTSLAASPEVLGQYLRAALQTNITEQLPEILCPVMVFSGSQDQVATSEAGRALAAMIPDVTYLELEGGSHAMMYEKPDDVAAEILKFIEVNSG